MNVEGIEAEILKKNIKNIYLKVLPPDGRVKVSVPCSCTDEYIYSFIKSKLKWIEKHRERLKGLPQPAERRYVSGESFFVLGRQYYLQVEEGKKQSVEFTGDRVVLTVRNADLLKNRETYVREWYRDVLRNEINKRLPELEERTGLFCAGWQIKNMTTRWGTCNPASKKLWFNLQLAQKPVICLEYVILHELLHLKIKNHGDDFIDLLDLYMPSWRIVKKELNMF